MADRDYLGTPL